MSGLNVLLDDGLVSHGEVSGIGHHTISLLNALQKSVHCEMTDYRSLMAVPRVARRLVYFGAANIGSWNKKYDVIHYQGNYVPFLRGRSKKVVTIYDLSVFKYPETVSPVWRHYNRHALSKAVERADAVIAISESIASEILSMFPSMNPDKLHVCPCGVREQFFRSESPVQELKRFDLVPFSYFLFVGDMTRRKNLPFLLSAFLEAKERGVVRRETKLVLVGKRAWGLAEFRHLLREDIGVCVLGYLPDDALVTLYRYAEAVVYPSLYEGFGIPIVEAMTQRTPIIISSIPTSVELNRAHGSQMLVFDLGNQPQLVGLLARLDSDHETIRSALCYGDLSRYSYDAIARIHIEVYEKVVRQNR